MSHFFSQESRKDAVKQINAYSKANGHPLFVNAFFKYTWDEPSQQNPTGVVWIFDYLIVSHQKPSSPGDLNSAEIDISEMSSEQIVDHFISEWLQRVEWLESED